MLGAGFLGTGASLAADITLLVQLLFFLGLTFGVIANRLKWYSVHKVIQTPIVILNFLFILGMVGSFIRNEIFVSVVKNPSALSSVVPLFHAGLGTITALLSIYLLLAGWKILPQKIGTLRYWMWSTYGMWFLTVSFGIATYLAIYVLGAGDIVEVSEIVFEEETDTGEPAVQRSLLQNFSFQPQELTVVAGTTVVWVNQDGAPHNVTFDDGSVASENFFQGETYSHTFEEPGVFPLYCSLHGNPGNGMFGIVTVVEASEENIAEFGAPSVVELVPPTPTPAPAVPLAPVTLLEAPDPASQVLGVMAFRDNVAPGDSVTLAMGGVEPAPAGAELHVWIIEDDTLATDLGVIVPNQQGSVSFTYTDPQHKNLMALYDGVQISIEPVGDTDGRPGQIVYSGRQAPLANSHIRLITATAEDTPDGKGYGFGARHQAEEVARHGILLEHSYEIGSLADAKRHAEHVLNIIEGTSGEHYGDLDGVHGLQDPGDGYGLLSYITGIRAAAEAANEAADSTNSIRTHADHVQIVTGSAFESTLAVREAALAVIEASALSEIGEAVDSISRMSARALVGEDVNGDGSISLNEGGVFIAYQHAQYMGAIGVAAGDAAGTTDPTSVSGDETLLVAGEIVIDMFEFDYSLESVTVPVGTKIRFVNRGQARHSATSDEGFFDTGLLDPGQEAVITLDETGFFPYYCVLHGSRGGVGMAANITVVEAGSTELVVTPTAEQVPEATAVPLTAEPEISPSPTPAQAPEATEAAPSEPTAVPTEEPAAEPSTFRLDMIDFSYSELNLEVPVGSTVTWFNAGNARHSATADDGSWDTGLIGSGAEASITFDTPGVYNYYCTLHGAPGGIGMSAVIIVTE